MKRQAGFTIVELVVVIALLGILAAVALPRFLDVSDDAHQASVSGVGGAFRSAVALVRAQSVVDNVTAAGDITFADNAGVYVNAGGFPQGAATVDAAACVTTWDDILQVGAPTAAAAAATGVDYVATFAANVCTYTYQPDTAYNIAYNVTTGAVTIDTTP